MTVATLACLALGAWPAAAHGAREGARLSKIGSAPDFALRDQEGRPLALRDLRGRVVALTFLYASCTDTCPLLAAKLVAIQSRLDQNASRRVSFLAITVDPEKDTPDVLKQYARAHGADRVSWAFLTGTPSEVQTVARRYGVYARRMPRGDIDHTFLTSIIDQGGILRVQYLGTRFDPEEFLTDLRSVLSEPPR